MCMTEEPTTILLMYGLKKKEYLILHSCDMVRLVRQDELHSFNCLRFAQTVKRQCLFILQTFLPSKDFIFSGFRCGTTLCVANTSDQIIFRESLCAFIGCVSHFFIAMHNVLLNYFCPSLLGKE